MKHNECGQQDGSRQKLQLAEEMVQERDVFTVNCVTKFRISKTLPELGLVGNGNLVARKLVRDGPPCASTPSGGCDRRRKALLSVVVGLIRKQQT